MVSVYRRRLPQLKRVFAHSDYVISWLGTHPDGVDLALTVNFTRNGMVPSMN